MTLVGAAIFAAALTTVPAAGAEQEDITERVRGIASELERKWQHQLDRMDSSEAVEARERILDIPVHSEADLQRQQSAIQQLRLVELQANIASLKEQLQRRECSR